jgi:hypothetical protein
VLPERGLPEFVKFETLLVKLPVLLASQTFSDGSIEMLSAPPIPPPVYPLPESRFPLLSNFARLPANPHQTFPDPSMASAEVVVFRGKPVEPESGLQLLLNLLNCGFRLFVSQAAPSGSIAMLLALVRPPPV